MLGREAYLAVKSGSLYGLRGQEITLAAAKENINHPWS